MWRKAVTIGALFGFAFALVSSLPHEISYNTVAPSPLLADVQAEAVPYLTINANSIEAVPTDITVSSDSLSRYTQTEVNQRMTGLLLHVRWLIAQNQPTIRRSGGGGGGSSNSTLRRQVDALELEVDAIAAATSTTSSSGLATSSIDTSAELLAILGDETGSGSVVFSASPTLSGVLTAAAANFSGNVGIGTTTPLAKLTLQNTGSGNSFIVEDQANDTTPFVIANDGSVAIGTATPSANTSLDVQRTSTLTTPTGTYAGFFNITANPAANSSAFFTASFAQSKTQSGLAHNVNSLTGGYSIADHIGTGTVTKAYGSWSDIYNDSSGTITNASNYHGEVGVYGGTITNLKVFDVGTLDIAGGTVTNTYGLYVGDITVGSQTNTPYSIYASDANTRNYFAGNTGIGTSTPVQKLQVFGDIRVGTTGSNGCLEDYGGGVIAGTCSSDEQLKENIEPIAKEGRSYLEALAALTPVTYNWNARAAELYSKNSNMENLGLTAQDVEKQFPELVSVNDDGYRQVDFRALPFYLLQALKELWAKVQGQDERLIELEQENDYLKERIENIENELDIEAPTPPTPPEPSPETPEPEPTPEGVTPTAESSTAPEPALEVTVEEPLPEPLPPEPPEEPTYVLVPGVSE